MPRATRHSHNCRTANKRADEVRNKDVAVARQGERGASWKYSINAVYLVAFLNFCPLDFEKTFRTDVALADVSVRKVFSDKVCRPKSLTRPAVCLP